MKALILLLLTPVKTKSLVMKICLAGMAANLIVLATFAITSTSKVKKLTEEEKDVNVKLTLLKKEYNEYSKQIEYFIDLHVDSTNLNNLIIGKWCRSTEVVDPDNFECDGRKGIYTFQKDHTVTIEYNPDHKTDDTELIIANWKIVEEKLNITYLQRRQWNNSVINYNNGTGEIHSPIVLNKNLLLCSTSYEKEVFKRL